jgi:hypothetical protein
MTRERPINAAVKRDSEHNILQHKNHIYSLLQMATSDQCALGPDGKLLDASDIVWVNDPDDPPISNEPIQEVDRDFEDNLPSSSSTIHRFFRGGPPLATMLAGSRRSKRVPHPSKHILDPDNSERPDVSTWKRPRPSSSHQKNIVESNSDENDEDCVDDGKGDGAATNLNVQDAVIDTDVDSELVDTDFEAVEEAYTATKAMGDADREVHLIFPWF